MNIRQKSIESTIKSLLFENKLREFGVYDGIVADTNTNAWDGSKGWSSARRWQRKSWIFFAAYNADIFVGFAIVDAGFIGKAFCYVYFPKTGKMLENGVDKPFAFGADFRANLDSHWQLGQYEILTKNGQILFDFKGKKFQLAIQTTDNDKGLSFLCPSTGGNRPFHFTYKNALLPTYIQFTENGKTQNFSKLHGSIDFSKGYPPRHTNWNWTSFLGQLEDGTPVGINLVDKFNENMENALWIGEERVLVGDVRYKYNKPLEQSLWEVFAINGSLELKMQPSNCRKENLNVVALKSKFIQVYGVIEGRILHHGVWKNLKGHGVMEEHEAIW